MPGDSPLRRKVAEYSASAGGYLQALNFVTSRITRLEQTGNAGAALAEARIIRAEVLQKLGRLRACDEELRGLSLLDLPPALAQGYLLIKAKLIMQQGDLKAGRVALAALKDKLGANSTAEINRVYLWRQAFTLGVLGEREQAVRLRDEHRDSIESGGFHTANNLIYATILPALARADRVTYEWGGWRESAREAGSYYAGSTVDFGGRLGHRGKSLCQALLTEAFLHWELGNRFDAYRTGFVAALLLRHWHLNMTSEGVGEVVPIVADRAPGLMDGIRAVVEGADESAVAGSLSAMSEHGSAATAYAIAMEITAEVLVSAATLTDIYTYLDDRRY